MRDAEIIDGKKLLIVDDEPDILDTLEEFLDVCKVEKALDFETARRLLEKNRYDLAILDIMGVRGNELLDVAVERGIPAIMLTAHAMTPRDFIHSMKAGANVFMPKDELYNIQFYVADVLHSQQEKEKKPGKWFERLKPLFNRKFGSGWLESGSDPSR